MIAVIAEEGEDISELSPGVGDIRPVSESPKSKSDREMWHKSWLVEPAGGGRFKASRRGRGAATEVAELDFDDLEVSQMRKTISRWPEESLGPVPHQPCPSRPSEVLSTQHPAQLCGTARRRSRRTSSIRF